VGTQGEFPDTEGPDVEIVDCSATGCALNFSYQLISINTRRSSFHQNKETLLNNRSSGATYGNTENECAGRVCIREGREEIYNNGSTDYANTH